MKARVVHAFDQPLVVEAVPTPEQVLVRIEASGLCHTATRGKWPVEPQPPFVPGHEGVGIVGCALGCARHVERVLDGIDPAAAAIALG